MKTLVIALALAAVMPGVAARADTSITIAHPWLRATPKTAPVVGGYATITNRGATPDVLLSAQIPMAKVGQIHTMTMKNGVMEMRQLDDGLAIAPGATVILSPGGDHMMFLKPSVQVKEGQTIGGSLTFKNAGTIPVTFAVGGMAAKTAPGTQRPGGEQAGGTDPMSMDHKSMDKMPMGDMPMDHSHMDHSHMGPMH